MVPNCYVIALSRQRYLTLLGQANKRGKGIFIKIDNCNYPEMTALLPLVNQVEIH